MLTLTPLTITRARQLIAQWHRHNPPPRGGLFAVGASSDDHLVGVAIVGRPTARLSNDGFTCEITRLATTGYPNACSILYGACARAAKALGFHRIITYTLASEPGTSLRASGFHAIATTKPEASWTRKGRMRYDHDLFGTPTRPTIAKTRWSFTLSQSHNHHAAPVDPAPRAGTS